MDESQNTRAEERFEEALSTTGARDPREYYRARLKELRTADPEAYSSAVQYYDDTLLPSIADGDVDPLEAWWEYGRRIAELSVDGRTVEIDPSGRSHSYSRPTPHDRMILHLPDGTKGPGLVVGLPPDLSQAQMASYDLLVAGKQRLRDEDQA
ncbi:MAG: hypothetical protein BMS9Abin29_0907 [Gemmatimonadota bacterium]|nr:MAG: hypothetical protein BMS9Abin29_0907 [Gemmatimonadota bacterium]